MTNEFDQNFNIKAESDCSQFNGYGEYPNLCVNEDMLCDEELRTGRVSNNDKRSESTPASDEIIIPIFPQGRIVIFQLVFYSSSAVKEKRAC